MYKAKGGGDVLSERIRTVKSFIIVASHMPLNPTVGLPISNKGF